MSLKEKVFKTLKENKINIEEGRVNCIPWPISGMRKIVPGIRQGKYYLMTAQQKTGKTQFSCYILFEALLYAYEHPDHVAIKILCFPLEETPELILERWISFLLAKYSNRKIRLTPSDMESINSALNEEYYDYITKNKDLEKLIDFFESHVSFYQSTNPSGIYKDCENYAKENGEIKYQIYVKDGVQHRKYDGYVPNNPKEYRIIWVDHIGLLSGETNASDIRSAIQLLSATYFVKLRNNYGFTIWAVQQQMAFDTVDAFKVDKIEPSCTNLSDNKATAKDANLVIALWSPYYMGKDTLPGLNISFRALNHYGRILKILANRDGMSGESVPLFMDGAVSVYDQLTADNINRYYEEVKKLC